MKQTLLLVLVLVLAAPAVLRAEEGAPSSSRWMLALEHGPLKILPYRGADGRTVTYHYMTLRVTNPTDLPRDWYPSVRALTDTKRTYVATGYDEALAQVREQERNQGLVAVAASMGKIAAGQTLDTVAIFGPLDPLYDEVRVQVVGLADPIAIYKVERYDVEVEVPGVVYTQTDPESNEAAEVGTAVLVSDVAYVDRNAKVEHALREAVGEGEMPTGRVEYWEVRERRAYEMIFTRPGDEFRPDDDAITAGKEFWTVIGDVRLERQIKM